MFRKYYSLLKRSSFPSSRFYGRQRSWTSLTRSANTVTIHALNDARFSYIWLRDSCQSAESIHPSTRQKLHRTSDVPLDIVPVDGESGMRVIENGLEILWKDGRKSVFDRHWLEKYSTPASTEKLHWDDTLREESWTRDSILSTSSLFLPYKDVLSSDYGLVKAMVQLLKYGLLFIRGVPNEDTSDNSCELKRLGERFGELRTTFYGLVWDVINQKDSKNIAYTNLKLGLHMDLLYFEHPPRYQILHCLRNRVVGGTSVFVDGLRTAQFLRDSHPDAFDLLTRTPVSFHYINDGHHLHRDHFTIELAPPTFPLRQEIRHINYSPPFQAPLPLSTPTEFYAAFKCFGDLLNEELNTFEYKLEEGDAVVFDNRRVLHARTAFRNMTEEEWHTAKKLHHWIEDGGHDRWLKGCYLEADAVLDRVRVLKTRLSRGGGPQE